jgi:hypothetical protein
MKTKNLILISDSLVDFPSKNVTPLGIHNVIEASRKDNARTLLTHPSVAPLFVKTPPYEELFFPIKGDIVYEATRQGGAQSVVFTWVKKEY